MGRPRKEIDVEKLEELAILNPTVEEIAAFFRIAKQTAVNLLKQKKYKDVLERGASARRTSLKRAQFNAAVNKGNVSMLIWLGKNELDQRDRADDGVSPEESARRVAEFVAMIQASNGTGGAA